jgi:hypothetical protein
MRVPYGACPAAAQGPVSPILRASRHHSRWPRSGICPGARRGDRGDRGLIPAAARGVGPPRGEHIWRGRCQSCPTSLSLGSIRMPIWGLLARELLRRTRWILGVWEILHPLWVRGWVCPGRGSSTPVRHRLLAMQLRSLVRQNVLGWRGRHHGWLRGQGEVSMCVMLTHSMVRRLRTRAMVGRTLYTSNESSSEVEQSSGNPPAAGVSWWILGVPAVPLRRLRNRATLSPSRPIQLERAVDPRSASRGPIPPVGSSTEEMKVCVVVPVQPPRPPCSRAGGQGHPDQSSRYVTVHDPHAPHSVF